MAETRERAHQENSPNETVRLYGRWYAPFSNGICWFSFILLVFPGLFRLFNPPAAGQEPLTPYLMLLGGLLFPLWHFSAACSPSTFLELSRLGFRRSVWGHARFYRWDELGPIKARVRYRGPSWVWAESRNSPLVPIPEDPLGGPVSFQSSPARILIDISTGFRPGFLFGGFSAGQLAMELKAWQAWAASEGNSLPPASRRPEKPDSK